MGFPVEVGTNKWIFGTSEFVSILASRGNLAPRSAFLSNEQVLIVEKRGKFWLIKPLAFSVGLGHFIGVRESNESQVF